MKKLLLVLAVIAITFGHERMYAQDISQVNDYKYVVIPVRFEFQDEANQYLLNSWLKHWFDQSGYTTLMETESYPEDLAFNRCLALYVELKSASEGFFSTYTDLKIVLKNCQNEVVYASPEGKSWIKDEEKAYQEALEKAFESLFYFPYEYNGKTVFEKEESLQKSKAAEKSSPLSRTLGKVLTYAGKDYQVKKIAAGYLLSNAETGKRIALMTLTKNKTILFNSKTINGTAVIADDGSITVEYFDRENQEMTQRRYTVK